MHRKPVGLWLFSILLLSVALNTPQFQDGDTVRSSATSVGPPLLGLAPGEALPDVRSITPEEQEEIIAQEIDKQWQHVPSLDSERLEPQEVEAQNGLIAYVGNDDSLYLINPDNGVRQSLVTDSQNLSNPSWSPDETKLAFISGEFGNRCVRTVEISSKTRKELDCEFYDIWELHWSPDGSQITFWGQETADGPNRTWFVSANGDDSTAIAAGLLRAITPNWIDNNTVVLAGEETTDVWYIYRVDISQPDGLTPITPAINPNCIGTFAAYPILSPDGSDIAYIGGRSEGDKSATDCYYAVYLVDPAGQDQPRKIVDVADTTQAGHASINLMRWAPQDSQRLGLLASGSDNTMRLTTVRTYDGEVKVLHGREGGLWWGWDWSPDRTRMAAGYLSPEAETEGAWELDRVDPANDVFTPLAEGRAPVWSSLPPPQPVDLEATGIEVTQAIQRTSEPYVPLIANKNTWVRVYARSHSGDVGNVTALLYLTRDGETRQLEPVNGHITVRADGSQRANDEHSFNFLLPAEWLSGTIGIRAEINSDYAVYETERDNNIYPRASDPPESRTFQEAETLTIDSYILEFELEGETYAVGEAQPAEAMSWVNRVYPVREGGIGLNEPDDNEVPVDDDGTYDLTTEAGWYALARLVDGRCADNQRCYGWVPPDLPLPNDFAFWGYYSGRGMVGLADRPNIVAHELAHTYGREHAPGCRASEPDSEFPNGGRIGEVGFWGDPTEQQTYGNDIYDFMSYCEAHNQWVSPYTYEALITAINPLVPETFTLADTAEYLVVGGIIDPDDNVDFYPTYRRTLSTGNNDQTGTGQYHLELLGDNGQTIFSRFFEAESEAPGFDTELIYFYQIIPQPTEAARVRLWRGAELLGEVSATPAIPEVELLTDLDGANLQGSFDVEWTASDADRDTLHFLVEYSPDGGSTWSVLALDLTETRISLNADLLRGTIQGVLRVLATDGLNTRSVMTSGFFSVADKPPKAFITSPEDGVQLPGRALINLTGVASDREDGPLSGDSLVWTLGEDTVIGTGSLVSIEGLTQGMHTVTLTATDAIGQSTSVKITLNVTNYPFSLHLPVIVNE